MDKKCLLTFFSVPLIFTNYLNINNLRIYPIFIRRATKKGTPMERYSNIPKVCHDINLMPYI